MINRDAFVTIIELRKAFNQSLAGRALNESSFDILLALEKIYDEIGMCPIFEWDDTVTASVNVYAFEKIVEHAIKSRSREYHTWDIDYNSMSIISTAINAQLFPYVVTPISVCVSNGVYYHCSPSENAIDGLIFEAIPDWE